MELIADLSRSMTKRKKKSGEYLLGETRQVYEQFLVTTKARRADTIARIFATAREIAQKAAERGATAAKLAASNWPTEAEGELARRDSQKYAAEAKVLRKERRAFRKRGWRFRILFWQLPDEFDPASKGPPGYSYWSCRAHARMLAHRWEAERITTLGAIVLRSDGDNDKYWLRERQLIAFQDRYFLAMRRKRADAQPHAPWEVAWVTESASQMTEKELRFIANRQSAE